MTAPHKPIDVGNGLVCASFGRDGQWLSLSTVHPEAGFVELTGLPRFAPEWRGLPDEVRRYRSWMRREEHAFLRIEAGRASISSRQDAVRGTRGVVQRVVLKASRRDRPAGIRLRVNGRLGPPALAEITEVAPPHDREVKSRFKTREGTLRVQGEGGPVIIQAWLRHGGEGTRGSAEGRSDMRIGWKILRRQMPTAVAWVDWPPDAGELALDLACNFDLTEMEVPDWLEPVAMAPPPLVEDEPRPLLVPSHLVKPLGRMNQRAASYVRGCTALRVALGQRALLADHRILPLSWTRDAYWQARLLLAAWRRGGHDDDERIVADHLRWLFLRCERPDGRWVRSHHADGRRKDPPFAADQQLYPLLELCDYHEATGRLPALPPDTSWAALAGGAWSALVAGLDEQSGLLATDENPADDVPTYQFLISHQVLLWHTATVLADALPMLGPDAAAQGLVPEALREVARRARESVMAHFVVEGPLGTMWAYAINGRGGFERYVDANDLPIGLAPLWGFCAPTDPAWQTTMRYAFDPLNPGFAPGPVGGLGSRHTPGTWTLGDIQGWVAHALMGELEVAAALLGRLTDVAFDDGMLPEAYDPEGSGSVVRHWFAWPGAALGTLLLDHAARETGD